MAAGQGFKTFTTGEVLTAGDVNGYLMQGINVFADAAARDAAITAPAEGQFAYTRDNNSLWYYTGSAWAASGATGDIEGVTVTSPLTGGGTSGTVTVGILSGTTSNLGAVQLSDSTSSTSTTLAATANAVKTTYDLAAAAIPKSTVTTNGDVIYATGSSAVTRLGIGSTGQVLTVAGGVPTWAAAGSSGAMTLIGTTTLGTAAADITFSSIASTYQNLKILFAGRGSSAGNNVDQLLVQVNGDTASNYRNVWMGGFSSVATTSPGSSTSGDLRYIPAGVPSFNPIGTSEITFMDYKNTTLRKGIQWLTTGEADSGFVFAGQVRWNSTSAISSIKLFLSSGNFIAGTSVSLYGWS